MDPFDPALITAPTRRVPVRQVVDLLHVVHARRRVERFRDAMGRGERFPPISVVRVGRVYVVADGHKRLTACKGMKIAAIDVEIWSIWDLARDLAGQSVRHLSAAGRAFRGVFSGREGRREARAFVDTTVGHWRRTVVSLWYLVRGKASSSSDDGSEERR